MTSSEVAAPEFFLAPGGRGDPAAELRATLQAFTRPIDPADVDAHPLCRFPARRAWLEHRLPLAERLPQPSCPALSEYLQQIGTPEIGLVYAASSLSHPASAFGHTFLRLRPNGKQRGTVAGGLAADFVADTDTDNPVLYAFKGLSGQFRGRFHLRAFESKRYEYAEEATRDLWEYQLELRPEEIELLVLHLWELTWAHIDYFYLTDNCSYQVLAALDAAAPRLHLVERAKQVVIPGDTVQALFAVPGLVGGITHYPSAATRRLARRSRVAARFNRPPEKGHASSRLQLGSGAEIDRAEGFYSIGYRLALHDLADPASGHPSLLQLQALDIEVRYLLDARKFVVERVVFAELMSLEPLGNGSLPWSWRLRAHGLRLRDDDCPGDGCFAHGADGGLGLTLATNDRSAAAFLLGSAQALFSGQLDGIGGSFVRLGVGPTAGLRFELPARITVVAMGSFSYLPWQTQTTSYELEGHLRGAASKNVALGVSAAAQPEAAEARLNGYVYF